MLCKVADLIVEIPEAGGLAPRCGKYRTAQTLPPNICILAEDYKPEHYGNDPIMAAYMDSGFQFYRQLLQYNGMMLHASAVAIDNRAYLFSGPCGTGKSTHTHLWEQVFGEAAQIFNDDKPALRRLDGKWFAYGTPWCGKDGINQNRKVPLAGICFLKQAPENAIRRLSPQEALTRVIHQTPHRFKSADGLDLLLGHVDKLVREIPIFEFGNRPEPEAAILSYETMCKAAQEVGL